MMSRTVLILLGLMSAAQAQAGEWAVGGGYIGETVTHPGLLAVVEHRLHPERRHSGVLAADLGAYWHPRSQWAPHVDVRAGYRYSSERHYGADLSVGVGYLRSYIAAETVNFKNTGRGHLLIPVDLGFFAWEFDQTSEHPVRLSTAVRLMWQSSVNTHSVIRPALTVTLTKVL